MAFDHVPSAAFYEGYNVFSWLSSGAVFVKVLAESLGLHRVRQP